MPQETPAGSVRSVVGDVRRRLGVSAANLARQAGVSRQTIHAIESGAYVPNTTVALRLSAALQTPVEELFRLERDDVAESQATVDLLATGPVSSGQSVRLCRVGDRQIAVPATPDLGFLPPADGILRRIRKAGKADVTVIPPATVTANRLVIAGCDPAIVVAGSVIERGTNVELVAASVSSRTALQWLHEGKVHIAGAHLRDDATGDFNLPFLKRVYPHDDFAVVTFAHWEEGLVCAPGNPKRLRGVADLLRRGVRFVNRETGSGSRALLDRLLTDAGASPDRVRGYEDVVPGHLPAANAVFTGAADACLATHSAARAFGLAFVPLERERYDFIIRRESLQLTGIRVLLDVLQRAPLRRTLEMQAGYDTSQTGSVLV